jgi:hypothetical protein
MPRPRKERPCRWRRWRWVLSLWLCWCLVLVLELGDAIVVVVVIIVVARRRFQGVAIESRDEVWDGTRLDGWLALATNRWRVFLPFLHLSHADIGSEGTNAAAIDSWSEGHLQGAIWKDVLSNVISSFLSDIYKVLNKP